MFALITRPHNEAIELANNLQTMGYEPLIVPMLKTSTLNQQANLLLEHLSKEPQIIITSPAGARAFVELSTDKAFTFGAVISIIVTGEKTASILHKANFTNILVKNQTAEELAYWLKDNLYGREILYCSGDFISFDITDFLQKHGFNATRLIIYQAQEIGEITEDLIDKITQRQVTIALFMSARTSQIFYDKLLQKKLDLDLSFITAYCFSSRIADNIKTMNWKRIIICDQPSQQNLLALVKNYG